MGKYKNISNEELIEFSGEHLYYEIWMLFGIVDLLKVKGIGEKSFQKIRPHVKVDKAD